MALTITNQIITDTPKRPIVYSKLSIPAYKVVINPNYEYPILLKYHINTTDIKSSVEYSKTIIAEYIEDQQQKSTEKAKEILKRGDTLRNIKKLFNDVRTAAAEETSPSSSDSISISKLGKAEKMYEIDKLIRSIDGNGMSEILGEKNVYSDLAGPQYEILEANLTAYTQKEDSFISSEQQKIKALKMHEDSARQELQSLYRFETEYVKG